MVSELRESPRIKYHSRGSFWLLIGLLGVAVATLYPIARWKAEKNRPQDQTQDGGNLVQAQVLPIGEATTIKQWHFVDGITEELAQFETVFWEPDDSSKLRQVLASEIDLSGKTILEVGSGTGLLSVICIGCGAERVVATDINPAAILNTRYNAERLGFDMQLEARLVGTSDQSAFSVVGEEERFDVILSNPPWEDGHVGEVAAYALYDPNFQLLDSFLREGAKHLNPDGELLLAYGGKTAIRRVLEHASDNGWHSEILDDRELADLPEVFVPAMVLRLVVAKGR